MSGPPLIKISMSKKQYLYCANLLANCIDKVEVAVQTKVSFKPKLDVDEPLHLISWQRKRTKDKAYFDTFDEAGEWLIDQHYHLAFKAIRQAINHIGLAREAAEDYDLKLPENLPYPNIFKM